MASPLAHTRSITAGLFCLALLAALCYSRPVCSNIVGIYHIVCVPWKPTEEKLINILLIFQPNSHSQEKFKLAPRELCSFSVFGSGKMRPVCSGKPSRIEDTVGVRVWFWLAFALSGPCQIYYDEPWWRYTWVICVRIGFCALVVFRFRKAILKFEVCFGQDQYENSYQWTKCYTFKSFVSVVGLKLKTLCPMLRWIRNYYLFWWTGMTTRKWVTTLLGSRFSVGKCGSTEKKRHEKEKSIKANAPHRKRMREVKWNIDFLLLLWFSTPRIHPHGTRDGRGRRPCSVHNMGRLGFCLQRLCKTTLSWIYCSSTTFHHATWDYAPWFCDAA